MNSWTNRGARQQAESSGEPITTLASHVDQQLVLDIGGEFLAGSGFEDEVPEAAFEQGEESNA
ncbi:MAG: hypothetical protein ACRD7E_05475 [Bryobacteraceae bacterium]